MDNLKTYNSFSTSNSKVLDSIKAVKSFKNIISPDQFKDEDIKLYSLIKVNIGREKLKIEKNDKWEYRITRINYDIKDFVDKEILKKNLLDASAQYKEDDKSSQINKFIEQPLEEISYYWNDTSLFNWFLPIEQSSYVDYNRNSILINKDWDIANVSNQLTRKIYLPKWDIEKLNLKLPKQKEIETNTIQNVNSVFKDFIKSIDTEAVEFSLEEIQTHIIEKWSWFQGGKDRIKDLILNSDLKQADIIKELKDEYWTWWGTLSLREFNDWSQNHSPWLWIMYELQNGQVFPFTWKKVYDIYVNHYKVKQLVIEEVKPVLIEEKIIKAEEKIIEQSVIDKMNKESEDGSIYFTSENERDIALNKIKKEYWVDKHGNALHWESPLWRHVTEKWKEAYWIYGMTGFYKEKTEVIKPSIILSKNWEQLWIFKDNKVEPTPKIEEKVDKEFIVDLFKKEKNIDLFEINKKIRFGMIKNNSMWELILKNQIEDNFLKTFSMNQLNSVREKINNKQLITATIPELKMLYEYYDLWDVWNSEFKNIFNSTSRDYTKWAFQIRFYDIVDRINKQDNPVQSLDSYFSDVRVRKVDYSKMDLVSFKKLVSGMSIIYNHDLLNSSRREVWEVVKSINIFMRWAKQYIWKNKLDFKEIDSVLVKWFLKNYKQALL